VTIRDCLGPLPAARPRARLPEGAWDMHFHVLGPQARFPYAATRKYTPPDAPLAQSLALHDTLGIARGLVVHANTHGFDNAVDLDAVARSGGRYLAVVRLDGKATRESCRKLNEKGARGVRFAFNPQHGGTLDQAVFEHVLKCIEGLGWFVELHFEGAAIPKLHRWLESIPATLVIDHIGRVDVSAGVDDEPFQLLCELMERPTVWVKVSGADRLTKKGPPYDDVAPFAQRMAEIAPDRVIWGSDWPHTGVFEAKRMPEDGALVNFLLDTFDGKTLGRIMVENPKRLLEGNAR
jgi:predicted TIM-barrel fold metal-dependent hydrolase